MSNGLILQIQGGHSSCKLPFLTSDIENNQYWHIGADSALTIGVGVEVISRLFINEWPIRDTLMNGPFPEKCTFHQRKSRDSK